MRCNGRFKRRWSVYLIQIVPVILLTIETLASAGYSETRREFETRTKWWQDARFGMFIHWGMSSLQNNGQGGDLSWSRPGKKPLDIYDDSAGANYIPAYDTLYKKFNPAGFNAAKLVQMAKGAGMKYIVPTYKHHEGFSMWFTKMKNSRDTAPYTTIRNIRA